MASVQTVKRARASSHERKCAKCGHMVQPGETYYRVTKRGGPRSSFTLYFCGKHDPRHSEITSGWAQRRLNQITKAAKDSIKAARDDRKRLREVLLQTETSIVDLADDIRDSAEAIEEVADDSTVQTENMEDSADELDEWAQRLTELVDEIGDYDPDDSEIAENRDFKEDALGLLDDNPELVLTA